MLADIINKVHPGCPALYTQREADAFKAGVEAAKRHILTVVKDYEPLTATQLADALDAYWKAAIGEAHNRAAYGGSSYSDMSTATITASGFQAMAGSLRQ